MLKNHKLSWPQVVLISVAILAFAGVWTLGSPDDRDTLEKAVLAVWGVVSTFLGPLLRKKLDHEYGDSNDESEATK